MSIEDRDRWDAKYHDRLPVEQAPDDWLRQCVKAVKPGRALELACGLGQNAIWLAEQGWQADAVDISAVGLKKAAHVARRRGISVNWIAADLDQFTPTPEAYDLVIVFRFLDRVRLPKLIEKSLAPRGLLVYETFSWSQFVRTDNHLKNPAFVLQPGELPKLFPNLTPLVCEEVDLADRSVARLLARK